MSQNESANTDQYVNPVWACIVKTYKILSVGGISIVVLLIAWFTMFRVDQVTDAIIALGDFGSLHHFVIFCLISLLWAFLIWYWVRIFYYIEYGKRSLSNYEEVLINYTPRILGAAALLVIGLAFLAQAPQCQKSNQSNPVFNIGIFFVILACLFVIFTNLRRRIFNIKSSEQYKASPNTKQNMVPATFLANVTRSILIGTSVIMFLLLIGLMIWPIQLTVYLGDGVTVLIGCLCIWLPLLYWIRYFSLKLGFPLFLPLLVLIAVFSFFNGNANVRLVEGPTAPGKNITEYYNEWLKEASPSVQQDDQRTPMIIALSEGGGIRAAYWSAQLMARIQQEHGDFRKNLFCISGVSGGSFGATVFDGLLAYQDRHSETKIQQKITDIVGKDFLSPTIACMLTRGVIQLLIPFPIPSFDNAKVFEETWEITWRNNLNGDTTFSNPFLSLWQNPGKLPIPPVFLNTTQVENGYPIYVSHLRIGRNSAQVNQFAGMYLPLDFYTDILGNGSRDVPVSTASHLSARFTYVSPAGTMIGKDGSYIGLVDGGYFDNTGANTAYQVLFNLLDHDNTIYQKDVMPVIVYIKNGAKVPDVKNTGPTMLYQLFAPLNTMMQIRDSNTNNGLLHLKEFVEFHRGKFIEFSLQDDNDDPTTLPLGWALSRKAQDDIDNQAKEIDIGELDQCLK
jgi:hypothetical protein